VAKWGLVEWHSELAKIAILLRQFPLCCCWFFHSPTKAPISYFFYVPIFFEGINKNVCVVQCSAHCPWAQNKKQQLRCDGDGRLKIKREEFGIGGKKAASA
jgi:hypothetical protein